MRNGIKLLTVLMMTVTAFFMWFDLSGSSMKEKASPPKKADTKKETPAVKHTVAVERSDGTMLTIDLEDYVRGVVASEMPVRFESEALKAQSVAARTFALQRNLMVDDTTSSQVYKSDDELKAQWGDSYEANLTKIKDAVKATEGEVLTYDGDYITAAFFSSCDGKTNNSGEYWEKNTPYLVSVDSKWDAQVNDNLIQAQEFTTAQIAQKLGFVNPIQSITDIQRYDTGYVKSITIDSITFSGRELREKLNLRSNKFTVTMTGNDVTFQVAGFGHGIGMSQYGAEGMAKAGKSYADILLHYYTGVKLEKR